MADVETERNAVLICKQVSSEKILIALIYKGPSDGLNLKAS
jgi:hypothetical protein